MPIRRLETSPALVVADIATGKARRVLAGHPSTKEESGFMVFLEGRPLVYNARKPTFPVGGIDGIALSTDSKRLYWTQLTGRRLYSIATDLLADPGASEEKLAAAVIDEGGRPACDGLAIDAQNRIYFGVFEQDSLVRRNPDGHFELLAHDPRIIWPDGLFATDDDLYVTLGQWTDCPASTRAGTCVSRPTSLSEYPHSEDIQKKSQNENIPPNHPDDTNHPRSKD